jgi:tetratricopeptide (TPR) repeat protein
MRHASRGAAEAVSGAVRALGLVLAISAAACASRATDAYLNAFAAGQRAYHAGRFREAARAFADAAEKAERVKDRDEAQLMIGRSYQRAQDWTEARAAYERLLAASPPGPRAPRAAFELAWIAIKHGDAETGWAKLLEAVRRHPKHGLARNALRQLVQREEDRGGPAAAVAFLRSEEPALRKTELDQMVQYELGRAIERSGDPEAAIRTLVATARAHPYPLGALTDNALFQAARIAEERDRPEEAIGYLRELIAPRERADTGSYERPLFDDAQLKIATLYRDALKDRAAARRELRRLYTRHTASILRDDALWAEAILWQEDGQQDEACAAAALLAKELPESRYARCVHLLCPSLPAPARPCAAYIERQIHGDEEDPGER